MEFQSLLGYKDEWMPLFNKRYHTKLERATLTNNWDWVESVMDEAEEFFVYHVKMSRPVFGNLWNNWDNYYQTYKTS